MARSTRVAYWIATGFFCAVMVASAVRYLAGSPIMVTKFQHLGYPDYFRQGLGVAKLLGVLALLVPACPRTLREWAYAGFTFDLVAAVLSHFACADGIESLGPGLLLIPLLASHRLARMTKHHEANNERSSAPPTVSV